MEPQTIELLLKIFSDRANYYDKIGNFEKSMTYETAVTLVLYAMNDNIEALRQFDYYGEES